MANHLLGAQQLPAGMLWTDEFGWSPIESASEYGVTGALIIDVAERLSGRPITLEATDDHGWMTRSALEALYGLAADPGATFTFQHADGRSFQVTFRPGEEPITARQLARPEIPPGDWPYVVTLRLTEV